VSPSALAAHLAWLVLVPCQSPEAVVLVNVPEVLLTIRILFIHLRAKLSKFSQRAFSPCLEEYQKREAMRPQCDIRTFMSHYRQCHTRRSIARDSLLSSICYACRPNPKYMASVYLKSEFNNHWARKARRKDKASEVSSSHNTYLLLKRLPKLSFMHCSLLIH
jgi:hypothetical protein